MTQENKIIKKSSLPKLFEKLKSVGKEIYAPVKEGNDKVEFKSVSKFEEVTLDYIQTVQSGKSVVFPKFEKLFDYKTALDGELTIKDIDLEKLPETVLFGAHPCDAASFASLNAIFSWDYKDKFFISRLQKLTVIGLSCKKGDDFCFCTSVGLNPGSTQGSDILLTKISDEEFLAEIITEKGKALADLLPELFTTANNVNKESHIANIPVQFDLKELNKKLGTAFEKDTWTIQALRCLGCGACAFVCPTCACFDMQDEGKMYEGSRLRCWDSCGFSIFTLHTSGHNPRETQNQRWRQRILHKFSYMPERQDVWGCVGCGRCSRGCPVDMNIVEHLKKTMEEV